MTLVELQGKLLTIYGDVGAVIYVRTCGCVRERKFSCYVLAHIRKSRPALLTLVLYCL